MTSNEVGLQIRIRSSADLDGVDSATRSMTGLGSESGNAAQSMRELYRSSHETEQILGGLERGGVGGAIQALRGLAGAAHTLGPAFLEGAAAAAVIAGPVLLAIKLMQDATADNEAAMKAMWQDAEDRAKRYKAEIEAVDKETKQFSEDLLTGLKEINDEMAATEKWHKAIEERQKAAATAARENLAAQLELAKQRELAGATTPEAQAEVERKYAGKKRDMEGQQHGDDLVNEQLRAEQTLKEKRAQEQAINDQEREADTAAAQAKSEYEMALASAHDAQQKSTEKADLDRQDAALSPLVKRMQIVPDEYTEADYDKARGDLASIQKRLKDYAPTQEDEEVLTSNAQEKAKVAKEKYDKLQAAAEKLRTDAVKTLTQIGEDIDKAQGVLDSMGNIRSAAEAKAAAADQQEANAAAETVRKAKERLAKNRAEEDRIADQAKKRATEGDQKPAAEDEGQAADMAHTDADIGKEITPSGWQTGSKVSSKVGSKEAATGDTAKIEEQTKKMADLQAEDEALKQTIAKATEQQQQAQAAADRHAAVVQENSKAHAVNSDAIHGLITAVNGLSDRIGSLARPGALPGVTGTPSSSAGQSVVAAGGVDAQWADSVNQAVANMVPA
jgi:DNA repair exonuclease SbcCD ATPase subunit